MSGKDSDYDYDDRDDYVNRPCKCEKCKKESKKCEKSRKCEKTRKHEKHNSCEKCKKNDKECDKNIDVKNDGKCVTITITQCT